MQFIGVSQKIRLIRAYLKISQAELAGLLSTSASTIQAIEEEQQELSTDLLQALVKKLNVSADWLLSNVGEMFLSPPLGFKTVNSQEIILGEKILCQEKVLDERIRILEERIKTEIHLPLKQIRLLFTKMLNIPLETPKGQKRPDELPVINLQDLSFLEKTCYYQELKYQMYEGKQEFTSYFHKLVHLVCGRDV
jgi:transcriptional regulator with XRE-family HTH domain